jgi:hypothetical protein
MGNKEGKPNDIWYVISLEPMIHDLRQMRQINRQMRQINRQMRQINRQMRQYIVTDLYQ